jgi:hypothetical protein
MFSAVSIKSSLTFFTEVEKISPTIHMEAQKTSNSQCNPEEKEQCWRYHNT